MTRVLPGALSVSRTFRAIPFEGIIAELAGGLSAVIPAQVAPAK